MFLRNKTRHFVGLARTAVSDALSVASAVVVTRYKIESDCLTMLDCSPARTPGDPPDAHAFPLWKGVSVSVSGAAIGPVRAPFLRPISLCVGAEVRRVIVFGNRRWMQSVGGDLVISEPEPFESIPLVFARAFGGGYEIPPGLFPGTELPFPGLRVTYPLNPSGIGFYGTRESAVDGALPNVELPTELICSWDDRPEPAGFAPCPELVGLRVPTDTASQEAIHVAVQARDESERSGPWGMGSAESDLELVLRMTHHAPGRLIFPSVPPATVVSLEGLGHRALRFEVPPSPVRVLLPGSALREEPSSSLRSLYIDSDRSVVEVVYGHAFHYPPDRAPGWVRILERETV